MNNRLWLDYSKIREDLDFQTVLQHYDLALGEDDTQIKIPCPFHDGAKPSLSIDIAGNRFQCFGCKASGNALDFIILMEGGEKSDKEALYRAATIAVEILEVDIGTYSRKKQPVRTPTVAETERTAKKRSSGCQRKKPVRDDSGASEPLPDKPSEATLPELEVNAVLDRTLDLSAEHPFLKARGISSEMCTAFELGFCKTGMMRNRIAIPIHDCNGDKVAYVGRYAADEVPAKEVRYKYPKQFNRSLEVFNLHRAKMFGKKHIVLTCGYWGVLRLHTAGIPAAALMGMEPSPTQVLLIKKAGFRFVSLLVDGNESARKKVPQVLHALSRHLYTRFIVLDEGVLPHTMPEARVLSLR